MNGSDPTDLIHGAAMAYMLEYPQQWALRRVEQIGFEDDKVARRSVSVDFQLPQWYLDVEDLESQDRLVPLALLAKKPLIDFDLRDEDGRALPLLTARKNSRVAAGALIASASTVLAPFQHDLDAEIVDDLESVASSSLEDADEAVRIALNPEGSSPVSRRLLARDPRLRKLAGDLSQNFLVLASISDPSQRRVIKYSYQEPVEYWRERIADATLTALGWRSARFRWITGGASMARSYHCEIRAPEHLEIQRAELSAVSAGGSHMKYTSESSGSRVHLYLSGVPSDSNAALRADLRACRGGLPQTSAILGIAISILLTVGAVFHQNVADSSDSAAALLIAVPALLAAYLVRPGEHLLATRLLFGVRWLIAAIGTLAFVAAASLTLHLNRDHTMLAIWLPIASLAWLATFGLILSVILPRTKA